MATQQQSQDSENVADLRATQQSDDSVNAAGSRTTQQPEDSVKISFRRVTQQSEDSENVADLRATQQSESVNAAGSRTTQQPEDSVKIAFRRVTQQSEDSVNVADLRATQQPEDSANVAGLRATQQPEDSANVADLRATQQSKDSVNVADLRATQQTVDSRNGAGLRATQQPEDSANVADLRATQQSKDSVNVADLRATKQPEDSVNDADLRATQQPEDSVNVADLGATQQSKDSVHVVDTRSTQQTEDLVNVADLRATQQSEDLANVAGLKSTQQPEDSVDFADLRATQQPEDSANVADLRATQQPEDSLNVADLRATHQSKDSVNVAGLRATQQSEDSANVVSLRATQQPHDSAKVANLRATQKPEDLVNITGLKTTQQPDDAVNIADLRALQQPEDSANFTDLRATKPEYSVNEAGLRATQQSEGSVNFVDQRATQQPGYSVNVADLRATQQSEDLVNIAGPRTTQQPVDSVNIADLRASQQSEDSANVADLRATQQPEDSVNIADLRATQQPEDSVNVAGLRATQQPEDSVNVAGLRATQQPEDSVNIADLRASQQSDDSVDFADLRATQQPKDSANVADLRATQQPEDSLNVADLRATQQSKDSVNVEGLRATQQSEDSANVADLRATQQPDDSVNVAGLRATEQSEDSANVAGLRATSQQSADSVNVAGLRATHQHSENQLRASDEILYTRSDRKSTSTIGAYSGVVAAPTYKATQQQSEDLANVTGRIAALEVEDMHCAPVNNCPYKSEQSKHISMFLNAFDRSLSVVKLHQSTKKRMNEIVEYFRDLRNLYQQTTVGSSAEGLDILESDSDAIIFNSKHVVLESRRETCNCKNPEILVVRLPVKAQPGYSKLSLIPLDSCPIQGDQNKKDTVFLKNNWKELIGSLLQLSTDKIIHGPAFHSEANEEFAKKVFQYFGFETPIFNRKYGRSTDMVYCIKGTQWPIEASEWTTRKRTSNWPTKEIFDNIINSGYNLAAVGSKGSKEFEIQWRISFNKAELLLIESFNETQMHCILLLKYFKNICLSDIAGNNITSYTMKTLMFWCIEETSDEFWQSENLMFCFCFCVSKLKSFVEKGFLPDYFIRDRNQFITSELTSEIKIKTKQYLHEFLKNPDIDLLLPSYKDYANTSLFDLRLKSQKYFFEKWFLKRLSLIEQYWVINRDLLWKLYDGYNIHKILVRCDMALEKLKTISYTQPLIKNLHNHMGVLQYILLKEEFKTGEHKTGSDTRQKYSKYMKLSASGDLTHNPLRIATCYLDDGVKDACLNIIRKVTESGDYFSMQTYMERLRHTLQCDKDALSKNELDNFEISFYNNIINDIDLTHQDPYRTTDEFERLKEKGHVLIGCNSFSLAWKGSYFDVTFFRVELPVLSKPAALELCIDYSQKHVSFHPFLYGLLLEFLWHIKYCSDNKAKVTVLNKMKKCVSKLPYKQQCSGLNFITYCFSLKTDYSSAAKCLIFSFKRKPVRKNVAYRYIKYIIKLLRKMICNL